jgi:hypothetical protein
MRIVSLILGLWSSALWAQFAEMRVAKGEDKSFLVSVPMILVGGEMGIHTEFNLWNEATIGLEYLRAGNNEEYSKKQMAEENKSRISGAWEVQMVLSRFSEPESMGGWFWSLGAGYRTMNVDWRKQPEETYTLTGDEVYDDDGRINHKLVGTGAAAHGRLGYRYVAASWPVAVGGYFGMRHYESNFKDVESEDSAVTPSQDIDREQLRRAYMTRPELAIELGMAF